MKILLINPPYTNFEGIAESAGHMMPLSLGYLASYSLARLQGIEFKILDGEALGLDYDGIKKYIWEYSPSVVGITTPTPAVKHVFQISKIVKELNNHTTVVLGGIHPSVMPERTLKECPSVDYVVMGEGEAAFCALLKSIQVKTGEPAGIEGVCYRKKGEIIKHPKTAFIQDLDTIPFPARDLYQLELYRSAPTKKISNDDATPILTSRGCPYSCTHCPSEIIWNRKIRFRSIENVVQEIEECVYKYNLKEFNFFDDTFTLKRERVLELCKKIAEKKMDISWICFSRTNTIDDELVIQMKSAGCKKISFGLESGDQNILDLMGKKTTVDLGRKAVQTVRRHGLPVHASFMFGNVGETETTIKTTIEYAKSLDLDNATFFLTTPFPGTQLYNLAVKRGNVTDKTPWERFAPLTNTAPILIQDVLSAHELVSWQKKAFKQFYLRPKYIAKKVSLLFTAGGISILVEGMRVLWRILQKK